MRTFILAAGRTDYLNMSQGLTGSKLLAIVNGRPIISWVIRDALQSSRGKTSIILDQNDSELFSFCCARFDRLSRVDVVPVDHPQSILHTLREGMHSTDMVDGNIHVVLGDTLLNNVAHEGGDRIWVSDYHLDSSPWCVARLDESDHILSYHNKIADLSPTHHKALVGRYDFSDLSLLMSCVDEAIAAGKREISDVLELYGKSRQLTVSVIPSSQWIDFGHLEGISKARTRLMESRAFNRLHVHELLPVITKTSRRTQKLLNEREWYERIPVDLAPLAPRVFSCDVKEEIASLKMEYYGYGTLAERFLFYDLSPGFWANVLSKLIDIVDLFRQYPAPNTGGDVDLNSIYNEKTFSRLAELRGQGEHWSNLLDADSVVINGRTYLGIPQLAHYVLRRCGALSRTAKPSIVHGDLCFNNVLYDIQSGAIKLIDPRGEFGNGSPTIYGDPRYDIAKIRHSYCGNYDHMIEGDFELSVAEDGFRFKVFKEQQSERDRMFDNLCIEHGYDVSEIRFIEAILFLSMVPLHSDRQNRQAAFFLTGLRKLNECYDKDLE